MREEDQLDSKQLNEIIKKSGFTPEQAECFKYFFLKRGCFTKVMSDAQYDQMVQNRLEALNKEDIALEKLGIDIDQVKEIAPVNFTGYNYDKDIYMHQENGSYVSPTVDLMWLFFSDTQIYMYSAKFNMFSSIIEEGTEEYFYKDVTAFRTETTQVLVKVDEKDLPLPGLLVNKFTVVVPSASVTVTFDNIESSSDTINGLKQKLREKKNA